MKFSNLFKKEIGGLLTKQAIVSMIASIVLFIFLGQLLGGAMSEIEGSGGSDGSGGGSGETGGTSIANLDDSDFTTAVLARIKDQGYSVTQSDSVSADIQPSDYAAELDRLGVDALIIIPKGYGDTVTVEKKSASLIFITRMKLGGLFSSLDSVQSTAIVDALDKASRDVEMLTFFGMSEDDIKHLNSGSGTVDYTTYRGKTANVPASALGVFVMMQNMAAPMVVFFLLLTAAQMIMTAISTEKIDKTLETLLSTPVSRMSVLMSKMLAAVVAALLNALSMSVGMVFYIGGMVGGAMKSAAGAITEVASAVPDDQVSAITEAVTNIPTALSELGLTMSAGDFLLFVLQLLLTVAIGLGISLILGAMATDAKSLGTLMVPIMLATMLPFFICMFADVNTMPMAFRVIMYLIPFTHAYIAMPNLIAGNMLIFWLGLVYQVLFFGGTMYAAVRMFMSDRLFTACFGDASMQTKKKNTGLFSGLKK
jgi:ABC-2 type transport system permease protein